MDYDQILASSPVNATAARQMGKGVSWTPATRLMDWFADMPPMKPESYYRGKGLENGEWVDFRGRIFGRLTVMGVMEKGTETNERSSWVCRCKCGDFCTRKSKSLKVAQRGGNTFSPMCGRCSYQSKLASGWSPNLKDQPKLKNAAAKVQP